MYVLSCFSHVRLFVTLWTAAHQAPLCTGFSRKEYRSGLPFPSPRDLPNPGIESTFLTSALACRFFTIGAMGSPIYMSVCVYILTHHDEIGLSEDYKIDLTFKYQSMWCGVLTPKEKLRISILIEAEKVLDDIQYLFFIKVPSKLGIAMNLPQSNKRFPIVTLQLMSSLMVKDWRLSP